MVGGKGEAYANIAEGLATAIQCFEDLKLKRDGPVMVQKHCILVCNSPPYQLPVMESPSLSGRTVEQLASFLLEVSLINPVLFNSQSFTVNCRSFNVFFYFFCSITSARHQSIHPLTSENSCSF